MSDGEATAQAVAAPTLWDSLNAWARSLRPWQQYVLGKAGQGKLEAADIEVAYGLLLADHSVSDPPGDVVMPPLFERPTEVLEAPLQLKRIDGIIGVNALTEDAALTLGPQLTVLYGNNGAGKSGFARLLGNACFSCQAPRILPNIYVDQRQPVAATFHIAEGEKPEAQVAYGADGGATALKRITVFDTAVARHHVSQTTAFEFRPAGFEVFPEMTRVYAALQSRLDTEVQRRSTPHTFLQSLLGAGTAVHAAVAGLSADTDLDTLRALGTYGTSESERLTPSERRRMPELPSAKKQPGFVTCRWALLARRRESAL